LEPTGGGWQRTALRLALGHADCVVALTPEWARRIQRFTDVRRIEVVGNVPSLPSPLPPRAPDPNGTIVSLGHLYVRKGVYELLDAVALLRVRRPGLRLVLAGEGPELERLRSSVASRPELRDAVDLPGWLDAEQKLKLLTRAACLVLPSYSEGLPLTLLEAMIAGVPIVATEVGGIPEVVTDGEEAILVPPQDASALAAGIDRILADPAFAEALAAAARVRVEQDYSEEALGERMSRIYDDVLAATFAVRDENDVNRAR
jgi:glycosyltransferase involved in cell wall biosynthesis